MHRYRAGRARFGREWAAAEFSSVGPRIHHYGRDATRTSSGRGTGLFGKPNSNETAMAHADRPARFVPKINPIERRPRPVDPVGARALRLERRPTRVAVEGHACLTNKPSPRPQRLTLTSRAVLNPRSNPIGLLADLSEAKPVLRPKTLAVVS